MLGVLRAGIPGALAGWVGFTMPSALALIAFGYGVRVLGDLGNAAWLHGLKIVAVAVVAQAVWGMARNLCPDRERATIAAASLSWRLPCHRHWDRWAASSWADWSAGGFCRAMRSR